MRGNKLFKFLDYVAGIPLLVLLSLLKRHGKGAILNDIAPQRILLVKFVALGDAVLLVPSLRVIREKFPRAEIIFLGTHLTETFLRQFPEYIDRFVTVNIGNIARQPLYFLRTVRHLRALRCDVALDFEQWSRLSALFVVASGARVRTGFRTKRQHRHAAFTHPVDRDPGRHEVDNFLSLAETVTNEQGSRELEVKVDETSLIRVQGFFAKHGWKKDVPIVTVHPGCGTHGFPREWAPKNYAALLDRLNKESKFFAVVSGTQSESGVMNALSQALSDHPAVYVINTSDDLVALLSMSSLAISSNNGAMHLAAALKIPQLALHGPTNALQWGPLNPNAVVIRSRCPQCPCLDLGFEYHRRDGYCMEQIDGEEVYQSARKIIGRRM